jgi:peptidoglycan-N-acetylglucosamine deacetylase
VLARKPGMASILRRMLLEGHDVGCHGLTHSEDYYTDSCHGQRQNLICAKRLIEDATGTLVSSFRAPAFRIANNTLAILDEVGFTADLSICSQRLPLLSSQIGNYHWLFSPREPYHPSKRNPYTKGDLRLLEIPLSAVALPLMSALNAVSEVASEFTTTVLRHEAAFTTKPIVYQCHIQDFVLVDQRRHRTDFSWRSLVPTKYGIPLRWAFEETDGAILYRRNQGFLSCLRQIKSFDFTTVSDYVRRHELIGT